MSLFMNWSNTLRCAAKGRFSAKPSFIFPCLLQYVCDRFTLHWAWHDILTHCGLVTPCGTKIWVSIGAGNGLVPDGTKPLPEPMLICDHWDPDCIIHLRVNSIENSVDVCWYIEAETRWLPFSRHFQMHFLEWKCRNFYQDFTEVCP